MARPKIAEKRSVKFTLQLTEAEKNKLNELAQTCNAAPAVLAREKIFNGKFPQPRVPRLDLDTYRELHKIGVNLNQLTHKVNAGFVNVKVLPTLEKLDQQLADITAILISQ